MANTRRLANEKFAEWRRERLPKPQALEKLTADRFSAPCVYIVLGNKKDFCAGETGNLVARISQLQSAPQRCSLEPESVIFVPVPIAVAHGLQSVFVERFRPILNTELLVADTGN